ncbi:MAG: SDR family NAD(P)-dependent oxidoreductase, partial [Xanthobacteraceae bacterium]
MASLSNRNIVVIGGSRGVGQATVRALLAEGARVLAIARGTHDLARLADELPAVTTLALDAADENAPARVFTALAPDVLVVAGGAKRTGAPLHELAWKDFSVVWDTDVKASFLF